MKKWIVGIIITIVIIAFIGWRLSLSPTIAVREECINAVKPKMIVPIKAFEGTIITIQVCGVESNHVYELRAKEIITSFTGKNHYFIPISVGYYNDDGIFKIILFDNTTQTIIDEKMIALVQTGGIPCDFLIMLAIPIVIILIIVGAVVELIRILKKWNYLS